MRVVQEMYCNKCFGYFRVTLNMEMNQDIRVQCPNCNARHDRSIKDGRIYERWFGRKHGDKDVDIIISMKSTYSKTRVLEKSYKDMRDGCVMTDPSKDIINDRWGEIFGDRV